MLPPFRLYKRYDSYGQQHPDKRDDTPYRQEFSDVVHFHAPFIKTINGLIAVKSIKTVNLNSRQSDHKIACFELRDYITLSLGRKAVCEIWVLGERFFIYVNGNIAEAVISLECVNSQEASIFIDFLSAAPIVADH